MDRILATGTGTRGLELICPSRARGRRNYLWANLRIITVNKFIYKSGSPAEAYFELIAVVPKLICPAGDSVFNITSAS